MYTVLKERIDIDSSHDIWEGKTYDECSNSQTHHKTLEAAKKQCLKNIDAQIRSLQLRRKKIARYTHTDTIVITAAGGAKHE